MGAARGQPWGLPWGQMEGDPGVLLPAPAQLWHRFGALTKQCKQTEPGTGVGREGSRSASLNIVFIVQLSYSRVIPSLALSGTSIPISLLESPGSACKGW